MPKAVAKQTDLFTAGSFSLENHPFYLFNYVFMARGRALNRELARFDTDYSKWRVLSVLNQFPDCTVQSLAHLAGVDRTTLSHTVRLLLENGLITRAKSLSDRRSAIIALTAEGNKTFRRLLPIVLESNRRCFEGFSDEDVKSFMDMLKRVAANISGDEPLPPGVGERATAGGRPPGKAREKAARRPIPGPRQPVADEA